ncbi:MAG: hypothetical protein L3J34_09565 [Flavobacteriaceae bacterium]|nr:hypothetical protein [Flavobacteriaceae bacterium]
MQKSKNRNEETLTPAELNKLAGIATREASRDMRERLDVILYVKDGYLIREFKSGKIEKIRKIASTKVTPGSIIKIIKK